LDSLLKAGYHIKTYDWADTDPDAYTSLQHRIPQIRERYPLQLPFSSTVNSSNLLPLDITHTTPTDLQTNFPIVIDVITANLLTYPPITPKDTSKIHPQELVLKHIIRLVHFLYISQPRHTGYVLANTPSPNKYPSIQERLGSVTTLDGPPCGSRAYRKNTDMPKSSPQRDDTKQFQPTSNPHTHHQQTPHTRQHSTVENAAQYPTPQTTNLKANPTHAST
jgi:hypothetical protein